MPRYLVTIFIALVAMAFILGSGFIKQNPDIVASAAVNAQKCDIKSLHCKFSASVYKDAVDVAHGLQRQSISKEDLPVVNIYMNDAAVAKLDKKRNSVFEGKKRAIHISEKGDWVKATITVDQGDKRERSKVSLRLKGDWGDHLEHPSKLSFRIKTSAGGYLFGLKVFSIQHPKTRIYEREPMMLNHMRMHGVLAPRYRFLDVRINDHPIGIMALEEHSSKEMLEAQSRRDGPIFALDEGLMWDQWNINYNGKNSKVGTTPVSGLNFKPFRDVKIRDYREASFQRGSIPTNNTIRGHALLRDFYHGKILARDVFDFDLLSKYWVITYVWGGYHSGAWHNRRHYYNPISGLLEPISFDNVPRMPTHYIEPEDVRAALKDPEFREKVVSFVSQLDLELKSDAFKKSFDEQSNYYDSLFALEEFGTREAAYTPAMLRENLRDFLDIFEKKTLIWRSNKPQTTSFQNENFVAHAFFKVQDQFAAHLTAFYYPSHTSEGETGRLVIRNLTPHKIKTRRLYSGRKKKKNNDVAFETTEIVPANQNVAAVTQIMNIPDDLFNQKGGVTLEYEYRGEVFEHPVFIQFENYNSGFNEKPLQSLETVLGKTQVNYKEKTILIGKGAYNFSENISVPTGWQMIVLPGAQLNFHKGSLLKLGGPLFVQGTKKNPVIINVESDLTFRDMGAWGGIFVSKSPERSSVNHLILNGTGTQNLNTRQGFFGMTGCFSFFDSDVTIANSEFNNAQCEDALNIVKSDFILDNITISKSRADAFDSDFSKGLITRSRFLNIGNDAIDVSGTDLELDRVKITGVNDKAVSVGEKSNLKARRLDIDGAVLGIASKDLSTAIVEKTAFNNISGTALITYIKKSEYGASSIECVDCAFGDVAAMTGRQDGTQIIVNGKRDRHGYLTQKQVNDAGLAEAG